MSVCVHVQPPYTRCHNGGRCVDGPANTYHCQCRPGYTGATCLIDVNECASFPCLNGGTCIDHINAFQCVCQPGFSGRLCQTALQNCEVNVCENDGLCVLTEAGEACLCRPDFHGERCQRRYNDCLPEPRCLHGGTCVDAVDSFQCQCPPAASGRYCQCLSSENDTFCVAPEHSEPRVAGLLPHLVVTVGYSTVFHTSVVATEYVEATASVAYDGPADATEEFRESVTATTEPWISPSFETTQPGAEAMSTPPPAFSAWEGDGATAVVTISQPSEVDWDAFSPPREPGEAPQTSPVEGTPLQTVPKPELTSPTLPLPESASPSIASTLPPTVSSSPGPPGIMSTPVRSSEVTPVTPTPVPVASSQLVTTSLVIPPEDQVRSSTDTYSTDGKTTTDGDGMGSTEETSARVDDAFTQTDEISTQADETGTQTESTPSYTEWISTQSENFTRDDDLSTQTPYISTTEETQSQSTSTSAQDTSPYTTDSSTTWPVTMSTQTEETSTSDVAISTEAFATLHTFSQEPSEERGRSTTEVDQTTTEEALTSLGTATPGGTSTSSDVSTAIVSTTDFNAREQTTTSYFPVVETEATPESIAGTSTLSTESVTEETSLEVEGTSSSTSTESAESSVVTPEGRTDLPSTAAYATTELLNVTNATDVSVAESTTASSASYTSTTEQEHVTVTAESAIAESGFTISTTTEVFTTPYSSTEYTSTEAEVASTEASTQFDPATEESHTLSESTTKETSTLPDDDKTSLTVAYDVTTDVASEPSTLPDAGVTETLSSTETMDITTEPNTEPILTMTSTPSAEEKQNTTHQTSLLPENATTSAPFPTATTTEKTIPTATVTGGPSPLTRAPATEAAPPSAEGATSDLLPIRFFPDTYLLLESNGADEPIEDPEEYTDTDLLEEVLSDERQFLGDTESTAAPVADHHQEEERKSEDVQPEMDKQRDESGSAANSFTEDAKRVRLKISFATLSEDGVVLSSLPTGVPPWYRLFLSGGLLRLAFACSGRQATSFIETQAKVNTGRQVTVHFVLRWIPGRSAGAAATCRAAMRLEGSPVTVAQQFADRPLDRRVALVVGSPPREPGFGGFLLQLQVNGQRFDELSLIVADSVGESRSPCDEAGCRHNSTCHQVTWMEVRCQCQPGFSGARCELAPCDPAPCGPGAQCALLSTGQSICLCPLGRTGPCCQTETTYPGARYQFHGSTGGLSSHLALDVTGSLRHQFWMFFHLATNQTEQTSLLALLMDTESERPETAMERQNLTVMLDESSSTVSDTEVAAAMPPPSNTNTTALEVGTEPERPWRDAGGDFFAVILSRGYVTVTWHLGSGSKRLMSEAPLDPEMTVQTVRVGRRAQRVWLQVNAQRVVTARAPGDYTKLDVRNVLHIGGYSGTQDHAALPADLGSYPGYRGCVFDLRLGLGSYRGVPLTVLGGRNVTPCRLDHCQGLSQGCAPAGSRPVRHRGP
ncbi:mucin-17-like [Amphibalanus amphitrite]|uniref:mucin-17-like n=1 Tax=Amphibalanus amphitrite TaxID=1232801 RepID=UPI001C91E462|nr:mucin-17-like [Amphibalanus amphitrite]